MRKNDNFLTHKILPFFSLFCFLFFVFFITEVEASFDFEHTGVSYSVPDLPTNSVDFNQDFFVIARSKKDYNVYKMISIPHFNPTDERLAFTDYRTGVYNNDYSGSSTTFSVWSVVNGVWSLDYSNLSGNPIVTGFCYADFDFVYSTIPLYVYGYTEPFYKVASKVVPPFLLNVEDFTTNKDFEYFFICPGSLTDTFTLTVQEDYFPIPELDVNYGPSITIEIDPNSSNFDYDGNGNKYIYISKKFNDMNFSYESGKSYTFIFKYTVNGEERTSVNKYTIGHKSVEQENQEVLQNTLEETKEINKNIFERIGDILSLLNPFSENFFAYKLVELLVNAIKGLFIPEDGYFDTYFKELQDWFSDRLGFLYYPIDILFTLLDRFMNLGTGTMSINIPNINEPFTGQVLISAQSLNFNELLANEAFKTLHNIYLLIVDASVYVGLVTLLYHKYEEVIAK